MRADAINKITHPSLSVDASVVCGEGKVLLAGDVDAGFEELAGIVEACDER